MREGLGICVTHLNGEMHWILFLSQIEESGVNAYGWRPQNPPAEPGSKADGRCHRTVLTTATCGKKEAVGGQGGDRMT